MTSPLRASRTNIDNVTLTAQGFSFAIGKFIKAPVVFSDKIVLPKTVSHCRATFLASTMSYKVKLAQCLRLYTQKQRSIHNKMNIKKIMQWQWRNFSVHCIYELVRDTDSTRLLTLSFLYSDFMLVLLCLCIVQMK